MEAFIKGAFDALKGLRGTESHVAKLYLECTIASVLGLLTVLAIYKILPYIASAIVFFIKFCVSLFVFALTIHLFKQSEIVRFVMTLLPYPLNGAIV